MPRTRGLSSPRAPRRACVSVWRGLPGLRGAGAGCPGAALSDPGWRRGRAGSASRAHPALTALAFSLSTPAGHRLGTGLPGARPAGGSCARGLPLPVGPGLTSARALSLRGEPVSGVSFPPRGVPCLGTSVLGGGRRREPRCQKAPGFRGEPRGGRAPGGLGFSGLNRTGGDPPQPSTPSRGKAISLGEAWCLKVMSVIRATLFT